MRKYGAFLVEDNVYRTYESPQDNGVVVDGVARVGFPTPSRKLEFFSKTLKDWKWPEHAVPGTSAATSTGRTSTARRVRCAAADVPAATLIHTRSGNASGSTRSRTRTRSGCIRRRRALGVTTASC